MRYPRRRPLTPFELQNLFGKPKRNPTPPTTRKCALDGCEVQTVKLCCSADHYRKLKLHEGINGQLERSDETVNR